MSKRNFIDETFSTCTGHNRGIYGACIAYSKGDISGGMYFVHIWSIFSCQVTNIPNGS